MKDFIFGGGLAYQGCSETFGKEEAQSVIAKGKIGGSGGLPPQNIQKSIHAEMLFSAFSQGSRGYFFTKINLVQV